MLGTEGSFKNLKSLELYDVQIETLPDLSELTELKSLSISGADFTKLYDESVNWENIAILNTDREGMTEELKDRFERLPYRKVLFVHKPDERHPSCFYIKGYENENSVGIITDPEGWKGKRAIDQFDYVGFLNG